MVAVRHRSPYLMTADKLEALEQSGTVWNMAWAATKKGIGKDKALLGLLGLAGPQVRCHKISPVLEATYTVCTPLGFGFQGYALSYTARFYQLLNIFSYFADSSCNIPRLVVDNVDK